MLIDKFPLLRKLFKIKNQNKTFVLFNKLK
jgi:hypothetical protein